jgi:Beta-propeller repeat
MKIEFPRKRFTAYLAAIAAISTLSLVAIFHFEVGGMRHQPVPRLSAARTDYGKLPLSFQQNMGQTDSRVGFVSRGSGYELFLTPEEAVFALRHSQPAPASPRERARSIRGGARPNEAASVLRIRFAGTNSAPEVLGAGQLPGRVDYFTGNNPKNWHTDVPSYASVEYRSIYPGVDLVFYGNQRQLEYDFVVAPGADPKSIALDVEGAGSLGTDRDGNLVMGVTGGEVELRRPVVYQQAHGVRRDIPASFALVGGNRVTFAVGDYDREFPLVIDPVINFSTFIGGTNNDFANGIAVDSTGHACIAGQTFSTDFPIPNGVNTLPTTPGINTATDGNVFVACLQANGGSLLYSAYLSGDGIGGGQDLANGIAVDSSNNIYVVGVTFADDFPVTTAASPSGLAGLITTAPAGNPFGTGFLSKINPSATGAASLIYSTYLGGSGGDSAAGVAADTSGNAYVTGITLSTDFPIMNGIPSPPNFTGLPNTIVGSAFLTRIDTTKSSTASLIYSTFLGGDAANNTFEGFGDFGFGVAVDTSNNAYVAGITTSSTNTFPTTASALQGQANASNTEGGAFFSKINTAGSGATALVYSTYLEGDVLDEGNAIAIGPGGVAYIAGDTFSHTTAGNFPVTNTTSTAPLANGTFPSASSGLGVAFLTLIDPSKSGAASLKYSVLLGGTIALDAARGVAADSSGNAYVAGGAGSDNFPVTFGGFQTTRPNASGDGFIAKINPGGNGTADLIYSSYFGGATGSASGNPDVIQAVAIDAATPPNAYITGSTASSATGPNGFPVTTGAFQTTLNGNGTTTDAFVAKLALVPRVAVLPATINFGTVQIGTTSPAQTITVTNNTSVALSGLAFMTMGGNSADFSATPAGTTPCTASLAAGASCTANVTFTPTAPPAAEATTLDVNDSDSSSPQTVALSGTGSNVAPDFTVTAPNSVSVAQGSTGMFTLTVTPVGGFNQTVNLACTGEPQFSTCNLAQNSVMLTDGVTPVMDMVTIATDVAPGMGSSGPLSGRILPPALVALGASMLGIGFLIAAARRRYRIALGVAAVLVIFIGGCGSGHHNRTPLGTTTLTITGTSGNTMHTAQVMLTVTAP